TNGFGPRATGRSARNCESAGVSQEFSWVAADVDPAFPLCRREVVGRRSNRQSEVARPGNQSTDDGVAHVVTGGVVEELLVGGEEREGGLQFMPGLLRLP